MYMIKKIFCIGDDIKSIPSPKINIFIFNNILFYCTNFCVNYHTKKKKETLYFFSPYIFKSTRRLISQSYVIEIDVQEDCMILKYLYFKFFPEESVFWLSCKYLETLHPS